MNLNNKNSVVDKVKYSKISKAHPDSQLTSKVQIDRGYCDYIMFWAWIIYNTKYKLFNFKERNTYY